MHRNALKSHTFSHTSFQFHTSSSPIPVDSNNQIPTLPLSSLQCRAILQSLTNSKSLKTGKALHALMLSSGILHKITNLSTKLAAFYANCGKMAEAQIIFDQIEFKSSFLWNYMIRGYTGCGFYLKSVLFYRKMINFGVQPDNFTYPFVIKACGDSLLVGFGKIIHGEVVISGFESDVYVSNCLLAMYSKFGEMGKARLVFDRMSKRDLASWNTMITGYAKNGYSREALCIFVLLLRSRLVPDSTSLLGVLSACSDMQMVEKGKEVHGYVLRNSFLSSNRFLTNSLVELYCKCKTMLYARRLFAVSSKDSVTWNTMISGYVQIGKGFEGLKLFCQMVSYGEQPDLATIIALLRACEQVTAIDFGMSIHSYLVQKGFGCSIMAATSLLGMYAQCGRLSCSQRVFDEIAEKSLVSWTAMISAYGHHGKGREAISVFDQMVGNGIVPDEGAFTCTLTACSHAGLVEDGREIFYQIQQKYGMKPALAHYECLVDLLSRAGHLEEAYEIINNMVVEPTDDVWVSLLSGCRLHGNVTLAEVSAQKVTEQNPNRVSSYISLSHIYADEKRWDDAEKLRFKLQSKGLAMPRGSSFIE
ncbi:pentatricopeptide repeat-containing protein DOT4, chloroplastic-like [Chenopodium quinoa]|uniref:pentatricopeptide repeat-containing protein DOT4, chloroplastic-like n=1 Tax=Chenopodium quinoa TaxID=63459 RepID=UPI000B76D3FE|nr:pentatricopeptide repeat-containing protein DOT4, chloroplastic-like [Chenopodium quinoa]